MKFMASLIVVKDIEKSRYLYEKVLRQKVVSDYGENIGFEDVFSKNLKKHFESLLEKEVLLKKTNSFELYFEEENIDEIEKKLKEENLDFIHEVVEQPWRQKGLKVYDYDGHIIEIGEPLEATAYRLSLEGKSIEEISEITYLDLETVKKSIEERS